jgi:hypothetical protein
MSKNTEISSQGTGSTKRKHYPLSFKQKIKDQMEQGNASKEPEQQI